MNPWQKAVDQQRVMAHIGIAADGVTDKEAAQQLAELIDWHVRVATDPAVNGGFVLMPVKMTNEVERAVTEAFDYWMNPEQLWNMAIRAQHPEVK